MAITLRGTVRPARDGWWIVARRRTRSGWETAGRARLIAAGVRASSFRLRLLRGHRPMRVRLTVTRPGTHLSYGVSRVVAVASR